MSKQKKIDTGGYAFAHAGSECSVEQEGMSLRDWLAGQCLSSKGVFYDSLAGRYEYAETAAHAYKMADAMIAERAKAVQS